MITGGSIRPGSTGSAFGSLGSSNSGTNQVAQASENGTDHVRIDLATQQKSRYVNMQQEKLGNPDTLGYNEEQLRDLSSDDTDSETSSEDDEDEEAESGRVEEKVREVKQRQSFKGMFSIKKGGKNNSRQKWKKKKKKTLKLLKKAGWAREPGRQESRSGKRAGAAREWERQEKGSGMSAGAA